MNQIQRAGEFVRAARVTAFDVMPPKFKAAFETMPQDIPEMTEFELETQFRRTMVDFMLRQRLWELVPHANATGHKITVDEWCRGICEPPNVHQKIMANPYRLSWLFTPLQAGYDRYSEMFDILVTKMRQKVLDMSITDENIGDAIRLLENITNRTMGPVPKNINLRAQQIPGPLAAPQATTQATTEDIDQRIAELEEKKALTAKVVNPPELPE